MRTISNLKTHQDKKLVASISRNLLILTVILLISGFLMSCNAASEYSAFPGITYIVPHRSVDSLRWSPTDASKLLVSANNLVQHTAHVYILDTMTKKKTSLVDTDYGEVWGIGWSLDGQSVALSVVGGTEGFEQNGIWLMDTKDKSTELLFDRTGSILWLPDGKTLAVQTIDFESNQSPRPIAITIVDIQTKVAKLIYSNQDAVAFSGFSASPDGNYLTFSVISDFSTFATDIFVLELQTGNVKQLTHDKRSSAPQWSSFGDLIVYQKSYPSNDQAMPSLHLINPDGSCDVAVPIISNTTSPTWSPDGRKIAFIGEDGIYTLDLDLALGTDIYQDLCS